MKKKTSLMYLCALVVFLIAVIGVSYAMYTFTGTGTTENVITTGQISVAFAEQNNIKIQNRYPETDIEGLANTDPNSQMTFTVSSNITGEATVNYAVGLTNIVEGATLTQEDIKIYLTKNGSVANGFTENTGKTVESFAASKVEGFLDSHAIVQGSLTGTASDTYTLKAWINEDYDLPTTDTSNGKEHSNGTTSEEFSFKIKVVGTDNALQIERILDKSGANAPVLATNMIPVYYSDGEWKKADRTNTQEEYQWYDYNNKMWANAVTVTAVDGIRSDLVDAPVGTIIPMERINTMLVWIPRFNVNYIYEASSEIELSGGDINITFVNKDTTAHDAFDFGGAISGFWIGKFETSHSTLSSISESNLLGCTNETCENAKGIEILPNKISLRYNNVSNFFYASRSMEQSGNPYGFDKTKDTTLDTHMLKNNEWGAVAYLAYSEFGRCTSSTGCTKIGKNNNSSMITGYGAPAGSSYTATNGAYNTALGMDASTTGNIYGVYDMNGGSYEYVMGVYWDGEKLWSGSGMSGSEYSGFNGWLDSDGKNYTSGVDYPNDNKYYNLYTTSEAYDNAGLQHAVNETNKNFIIDYFVTHHSPWFSRGGGISNTPQTGIFNVAILHGGSSGSSSFRLSITVD